MDAYASDVMEQEMFQQATIYFDAETELGSLLGLFVSKHDDRHQDNQSVSDN